MTDRPIRASDRERDNVVDVLRDAYTEGRLTLEEFEERTSAAYASKTWGDLRELTVDLPVQPVLGADLPERLPRPQPVAQQVVPSLPSGRSRPPFRGWGTDGTICWATGARCGCRCGKSAPSTGSTGRSPVSSRRSAQVLEA